MDSPSGDAAGAGATAAAAAGATATGSYLVHNSIKHMH